MLWPGRALVVLLGVILGALHDLSICGGPLDRPTAIVVCCTREAAVSTWQMYGLLSDNTPFHHNARGLVIPDGSENANAPVVIGTPGGLMECLRKGNITTNALKFVILDNAERMTERIISIHTTQILAATRPAARTILISSSELPEHWLQQFSHNPVIDRVSLTFTRSSINVTWCPSLPPYRVTDLANCIVSSSFGITSLSNNILTLT